MTVYFVEEIGTGNIKIGYCSSYYAQSDRVDPSRTMTSHELVVRAVVADGTMLDEKKLHSAFSRWRIYRRTDDPKTLQATEFFRPSFELWSLIGYVSKHESLPFNAELCSELDWTPSIPIKEHENIPIPY